MADGATGNRDDVYVWHAQVDQTWNDRARLARAIEWLTPPERARYARYRFEIDRAMFLLGRVMARTLVGRALGVAPRAWTWRDGARGRPEVADPPSAIHFNLAHSTGVVVCAVSCDHAVGVDVEDRERHVIDRRLVRRFCSAQEADDIEAAGDRWRDRFLRYWTLKEAYLKARGVGIAVHLADVNFVMHGDRAPVLQPIGSLVHEAADWAFALTSVAPRHYVAVAVPSPRPDRRFVVEPLPLDWLP